MWQSAVVASRVMTNCSFCRDIEDNQLTGVLRDWGDVIALRPYDPLLPNVRPAHWTYRHGHFIVIPRDHIGDELEDPHMAGEVARCAAELARDLEWTDGHFAFNVGTWSNRSTTHMVGHQVYADEQHQHTMPWFGQRLRDGVDYFIVDDGDTSQLWRGPADSPVTVGDKAMFDSLDPLLWPALTAVLTPTPLPER